MPLPPDAAAVGDGGVFGTCTIAFSAPRTLPAHVHVHVEHRVADGADPCADPTAFTALDLDVADFGAPLGGSPTGTQLRNGLGEQPLHDAIIVAATHRHHLAVRGLARFIGVIGG